VATKEIKLITLDGLEVTIIEKSPVPMMLSRFLRKKPKSFMTEEDNIPSSTTENIRSYVYVGRCNQTGVPVYEEVE